MSAATPEPRLRSHRVWWIVLVSVAACGTFLGVATWFGVDRARERLLQEEAEATEANDILAQRLQSMRRRRWTEVCRGEAVARWLQEEPTNLTHLKTDDIVETLTVTAGVSVNDLHSGGPSFVVERSGGGVAVQREADLKDAPFLVVEASISWEGLFGSRKRNLRTITARFGTRLDALDTPVPP